MAFLLPYTASALYTFLKGHLLLQAAWESIKRNIRMLHDEDHWHQDGEILELLLKPFKAQVQTSPSLPVCICTPLSKAPAH